MTGISPILSIDVWRLRAVGCIWQQICLSHQSSPVVPWNQSFCARLTSPIFSHLDCVVSRFNTLCSSDSSYAKHRRMHTMQPDRRTQCWNEREMDIICSECYPSIYWPSSLVILPSLMTEDIVNPEEKPRPTGSIKRQVDTLTETGLSNVRFKFHFLPTQRDQKA